MNSPEIRHCPGTLAPGHSTYSRACLKQVFNGRKVYHVLPYDSPTADGLFAENRRYMSISGVQEKYGVLLEKNKLRLTCRGEQATHILKPIPPIGRRADQMPANEHLTMQVARQIFGIETAANALVFFKDGQPAYITRRFDLNADGTRRATEDFAALAGRTPQTHGEHYKYLGNYLDVFAILKQYVPAYKVEADKLFKLLIFNYLFSNGDAHLKNFSLLETEMGDFCLSPAYDLLNSRIHIEDQVFALDGGLLPAHLSTGRISAQFRELATLAGLPEKLTDGTFHLVSQVSDKVEAFVAASFLDTATKRNYLQSWQTRLKRLMK